MHLLTQLPFAKPIEKFLCLPTSNPQLMLAQIPLMQADMISQIEHFKRHQSP